MKLVFEVSCFVVWSLTGADAQVILKWRHWTAGRTSKDQRVDAMTAGVVAFAAAALRHHAFAASRVATDT